MQHLMKFTNGIRNRTPMWQDSLLDTCGGLTGIIISNWFWNRKSANLISRLALFAGSKTSGKSPIGEG